MLARSAKALRRMVYGARPLRRGLSDAVAPHTKQKVTKRLQTEQLQVLTSRWAETWSELVKWEQAADTATAQERVAHWGEKRLKAEGHMLDRLSASCVAENIVAFSPQYGEPGGIPEHRFSTGDTVTVCRGNPLDQQYVDGRDRMEGLLVRISANALHIKLQDDFPADITTGTWRLDRGTNGVSSERQCNALDAFVGATVPDIPCDMWLKVLLLDDEELMAKLRVDASKLARAEPVGVPTAFRRTVDGELVTDSAEVASLLDAAQLNESQRNAVTSALAQRLTLIQGPPGTGKTHCSVQLLKMFVANQRELSAQQGVAGEHTVLATANSNTAADNLLEGLLAEGVKAVRAGPRDKVRPTLQAASMQAKMEHHPARKVEKQLEEIVAQLVANLRSADDIEPAVAAVPTVDRDQPQRGGRMGEMSRAMGLNAATAAMLNKPKSRRELKDKLHRARTQLEELRKQIKEDIYSSTEVVVATCIAAGELVDTGLFKVVLIDEASQSTVPTCLVPISKGCRQLVLVGDSNQLPPTVKTDRAMQGGLNRSLFERLQDMGISSIMLNTQYRMHPTIAAFSSEHFYRGELRSADNVASLVPPAGFDWPIRGGLSVPVAFVEAVSDSGEDISLDGASRSNYKEAEAVVGALRDLLMAGDVAATDIGIVTPYKGQVELLGKMLATEPMFEGVEVNSVDGYQGREKELVMFSAVRSNPERRVGFLADWRRLNVAITRAKRGLLMFGDPETLRGDEIWANLLDYFAALAVESNGAGPNKLSSGIFESVISPELDQLQRA